MSGTDDLVPAQPGRIRDDVEEAKREVRSLAARAGNPEVGLTGRLNLVESSVARISVRLDHRNARLDPSPV